MGREKVMNILILGIGNVLFQDEGIGVHFIHYLDEKYEFKSNNSTVNIIDGGTLAQRLIPQIVQYNEVIVVDCIAADNSKPGDVFFFDYKKAPSYIDWQGSAHEVEMLQTLNMIDMQYDLPNTNVLGVIPKRLYTEDTTFDLSNEIIDAVKVMENVVLKHLESLKIEVITKNSDTTIQEISLVSFKRDIVNYFDIN